MHCWRKNHNMTRVWVTFVHQRGISLSLTTGVLDAPWNSHSRCFLCPFCQVSQHHRSNLKRCIPTSFRGPLTLGDLEAQWLLQTMLVYTWFQCCLIGGWCFTVSFLGISSPPIVPSHSRSGFLFPSIFLPLFCASVQPFSIHPSIPCTFIILPRHLLLTRASPTKRKHGLSFWRQMAPRAWLCQGSNTQFVLSHYLSFLHVPFSKKHNSRSKHPYHEYYVSDYDRVWYTSWNLRPQIPLFL